MSDIIEQMAIKIAALERRINGLETQISRPVSATSSWSSIISAVSFLPMLRASWPMSSVKETGAVTDVPYRGMELTNNGTCPFGTTSAYAPFVGLNGSSQYLSRADGADVDLTGAFTIGGWFWMDTGGAYAGLMSKYSTAGNYSYLLTKKNTDKVALFMSGDGTNVVSVESAAAMSAYTWYFCVARYTPSTEIAVFLNNVKAVNTTSIPAACYNSTSAFEIGAYNGAAGFLDGAASMCFMCGAAVSDAILSNLFEVSRKAYGV